MTTISRSPFTDTTPAQRTASDGLILRKITYPGIAVVVLIPLGVTVSYFDRYFYRATFWGVDVEGLIGAILYAIALCVSCAIATRSLRRTLVAIPLAVGIGLVSYKVGEEFMSILNPAEYRIGLGSLGQFLDRHCSLTFGCDMGDLVGGLLLNVLASVFLASSASGLGPFFGGSLAGTAFSFASFTRQFYLHGAMTVDGPFQLALGVLLILPTGFAIGAALSSSVIVGQMLVPRILRQRGKGVGGGSNDG